MRKFKGSKKTFFTIELWTNFVFFDINSLCDKIILVLADLPFK